MACGKYALGFISDHDIYEHVKETLRKYRVNINLQEFHSNIIDPIKLTFDSKVYKKSLQEVLEDESKRQIDKTNANLIGYFHQHIFRYLDNDWTVPTRGYDVVNTKKKIYVEMKNKHNTMNSSSSQKTYMRMQKTISNDSQATCYLVEVIAGTSQNITWITTLEGNPVSHKQIRKISIDKFYELVTNDYSAFKKLCEKLPIIIDDVLQDSLVTSNTNTVLSQLQIIDTDLIEYFYSKAFNTYQGFKKFG